MRRAEPEGRGSRGLAATPDARRRTTQIRRAVFSWAAEVERPLPWRGDRDPYRVLVSEVMLQQTQARRVAPIYERFLVRFPTVASLAAAEPADVLRAWENLGYNRRALNLWRSAVAVQNAGGFPTTVEELVRLPGIGPYTARAVASFAFDADVAAVDVNVRRVVARLHGDGNVQTRADALVPRGRSARWNQAMIDLGAEVCRARLPDCAVCPVRTWCRSRGVVPPPTRRSTVSFRDTTRFARGRVVAALRSTESLTLAGLQRTTGLETHRLRSAVRSLEADGLVARRRDVYALPRS